MARNPNGPIRRAQAIAPFGVGAMVTVPGGTTLIIGGLDNWYAPPTHTDQSEPKVEGFKFQEWRLQQLLDVNHFRHPPDYRESWRGTGEMPNAYITLPALRFPTWHFCHFCHRLEQRTPYEVGKAGRIKCPECEQKRRTSYLFQVPFVAMCSEGHLQDFPWREWVHQSARPTCDGTLRLKTTGSASLAGQLVSCDGCKSSRRLGPITQANEEGTALTRSLDASGAEYLCRGQKPWLGPDAPTDTCTAHLRGALRNAMNVYYAQIRSAIYLPPVRDEALQELVDLFERPPLSSLLNTLASLGAQPAQVAIASKQQHGKLLQKFTQEQIASAVEALQQGYEIDEAEEDVVSNFRHDEYQALRTARNEPHLRIREELPGAYGTSVTGYFSRLLLVDRLRETRAMAGFTRVFPETAGRIRELKTMLARSMPAETWLPAYIVHGEGLYFELADERLAAWEQQENVIARVAPLARRFGALQDQRRLDAREISPRFVLLHTLAHLLINQLTFDCGYSSASLRERLYASTDPHMPCLLYTSDAADE